MLGSPIHITPAEMTSGWASLQNQCAAQLSNLIDAHSADGLATAWTALSIARLTSLVTVTKHRAQRLNRLTAGALLTHPDFGLFGDKDVDPYRIWRVFPYSDIARQVLSAVRADIELLRQKVRDIELDLRAQIGEPGAPLAPRMCLFFGLVATPTGSRVQICRQALRRRDVSASTKKHLQSPANIGRHFLCTELALAGTDALVIAAGTNHGHIGAEVFSDSMAVAPADALSQLADAIATRLEELGLQKVPGSQRHLPTPEVAQCPAPPISNDAYLHPKRSADGRILPPYADPHTLVALRTVGRAWRALASSATIPELGDGIVAACAAVLDGIHPADLMEVQAQMPGALATTGLAMSFCFTRTGCAGEIPLPLCARTAVAINSLPDRPSVCSDAQMRLVGAWIRKLCPEVTWSTDDREVFLQLCALAQRWHRFHEAPSTMAAASRAIYAAAPNRESVLRLSDPHRTTKFENLPFVPIRQGISRQRTKLRSALKELKSKLGTQGNTKVERGEEQKRARVLLKSIQSVNTDGDLPALRAKEVLSKECECWLDDALRGSKAGRQFSSLANYGARSFAGLTLLHPGDDMSTWPAPDFVYWFKRVERLATESDADGAPSMAGVRRFLLVGRDHLGWDVPDELLIGVTAFKTDGKRKAAASTLLFSFDYAAAETVVRQRLVEWPYLLQPALIDLRLRSSVPLRSGERSTLLRDCLTLTSNKLILRTTGHSDQKSEAAVRLCGTPESMVVDIRSYAAQPARMKERFLFLDEDGSDWTCIASIDQVENEAMTLVTGDPSYRPHCGRASAGCQLAWPDYETAAQGIYQGRAVSACSAVTPNLKFNRVVAATFETGQGHASTFLTYYAAVWPFLRAITTNARLRSVEPDDAFVRAALGEPALAAVRKALSRARAAKESFSAWDVIGRLATKQAGIAPLVRTQPSPVLAPDTSRRNQPASKEVITNYVLARATGTTRIDAAKRFGIAITLAQTLDLEMNRREQ